MHNKKRIPLLNLFSNCISAKPAPQVLSLKDECTFRFLSFVIIRFCSSSDYTLFCMISFLTAPPTFFFIKKLDIHHIQGFYQY